MAGYHAAETSVPPGSIVIIAGGHHGLDLASARRIRMALVIVELTPGHV
jgi:hypothetical protein